MVSGSGKPILGLSYAQRKERPDPDPSKTGPEPLRRPEREDWSMKPLKRSFLLILVFMTIWIGNRSEAATKKSGAKSKISTTLTLKEAEEEAWESSPYYQRSQAVEREMSWEQLEAVGEGFLPHFSLGGQHFLTEQYSYLNVAFGAFPPSQFPGIYPLTTLT